MSQTPKKSEPNKQTQGLVFALSHDVKNVLNHIAGFLTLLETNLKSQFTEQDQHYFEVIQERLNYLGKMLNELCQYSNLATAPLNPQKIPLNTLIENVTTEQEMHFPQLKIHWDISALPFVFGDPILLKQVFSILLENAIKFSQTRQTLVIKISSEEEKSDFIQVSIQDNGIGFNEQYGDRLFGLFKSLHNDTEFSGLATNLAKAKQIVELHHGNIWANAVDNHGATFHVTLPLTESAFKGP